MLYPIQVPFNIKVDFLIAALDAWLLLCASAHNTFVTGLVGVILYNRHNESESCVRGIVANEGE